MSKIILYIATSEDGFIADKNGEVDWLPQPQDDKDLEAFGYKKLLERIDTIMLGSKSYTQIMCFGDWAWPKKKTYVFTSKDLKSEAPYIEIVHDSPLKIINLIKKSASKKDIWLLGGAELVRSFGHYGLIDEIVLTIVSHKLGEGIPLGLSLDNFDLISEIFLRDEIIQRVYIRKSQ